EAAAAGAPPLVARHSGLAEVAARLAEAYPPELAHLTSFTSGDVADLRAKLAELLALDPATRRDLGRTARQVVLEHWRRSSGAEGRLDPIQGSIPSPAG